VTFLHPLALVGLAAAAIPALLHLLERRVPPEAEFPPLRYLSETERQNARRLKLRHLLLLILRTLPGSAHAIAAALERLICEPALRVRLGEAGARRAPEFDWSHVTAQLVGVYEEVIGKRRAIG